MKRTLTIWAGLAAAVLAGAGVVQAQTAPDCPASLGTKTTDAYVSPYNGQVFAGPTITTPITYTNCPQNGCCDKITITGIPAGYRLGGILRSSYVFTGSPDYPTGRLVIEDIPVSGVSTGPDQVFTFKVCYPKVHDWPSFETHVDVFVDIQAPDGLGGFTNVALFGPGTDWDTFCFTFGCTIGKWKNWTGEGRGNQTNLWPAPFKTTDSFRTAFGVSAQTAANNVNLLQALDLGGGGERAMIRQCTGTLLNAQHAANKYGSGAWAGNNCEAWYLGTKSVNEVKAIVQNAYASNSTAAFNAAASMCGTANESVCVLDGVWAGTSGPNGTGAACNLP
jgi:hypothetical protein